MKNFMTLLLALLFMAFVTSCGSDSKTDEKLPDEEVTDEDVVEPTDEPTNPTDEPTNPTDEPTEPTDEPTEPTDEPTNPTDEPTNPTDEPTEPTDEPTNPTDEPTNPTEPEETGSCTYIPNAFVSNWTDNFPTGWVKKGTVSYEKIDRGEGNYALRTYIAAADATKNGYAFELPPFVTNDDAAFPTKLTFDLKASSTSRISINIRCGENENPLSDPYKAYNWDTENKVFVNEIQNDFIDRDINLGNSDFNEVTVILGNELKDEGFWRDHNCRIEFKYGKNVASDITVDNFVFHTATEDCVGEDTPDPTEPTEPLTCNEEDHKEPNAEGTECVCIEGYHADGDNCVEDTALTCDADAHKEPNTEGTECVCIEGFHADGDNCVEDTPALTCDAEAHKEPNEAGTECVCMEGFVADGDDCVAPKCAQIPNSDFSDWDSINDAEKKNWQIDSLATYSNVNGALNVAVSSQANNGTAFDSAKFVTSSDSEVPVGIKFKLATIKSSKVAISFHWGSSGNNVFYAYYWDGNGHFVYNDKKPTTYNYDNPINFGDTEMKEVTIIFGTEITEEIWHKSEDKFIRFKYGKGADYEIRVDDFELVYYGGECGGEEHNYSVGWASIQYPKDSDNYTFRLDYPVTFYGRVYIEGLTDQTVNSSEFLMGVRAQFGVKAEGDADYEWYEASVNETSSNSFGNNDEYQYTYVFTEPGNYEYKFRFSADNGKTWTETSAFSDEGDHVGTAHANVPELSDKDIIWNGDFSVWASDTEPWLWTTDKGSFEKVGSGENPALKVSATKGSSAKSVLKSHSFEISDTAALPQKIAFQLATDTKVTISILLDCGEGSKFYYKWNKTDHFVSNGSWQYNESNNPLAINFGNSDLNDTWIDTSAITAENWNGKSCTLEFKFGGDSSNDRWAIFDNFTIVPAE